MASLSIPLAGRASPSFGSLWIAPPALVLAILFFYPLALIAGASFAGSGGHATFLNYAGMLGSVQFVRALGNTVKIAV
ncbi:MAG: hypothetical protein ACREFO_19930, partial [Acetobacteraceae bacterium]